MSLLSRVSRFAARHEMWRPDTRVVAAVSGGSDSIALLFLLRDLHARRELVLDGVAHLNHSIRGDEAHHDEAFCRALADRLELPIVSARIDVPAKARQDRLSIEVAGRNARRAFLDEVRQSRAADAIATAHTADDQAETVLLRLVRGTGVRGLGGIAPVRDRRIRPLLECSREELRNDLRARREAWREDLSNADVTNPRNRVRHELLPYLERHFNPSVGRSLWKLADLARADEATLVRNAVAAAFQVLHVGSQQVRLDAAALTALPDAIARRVVQIALEALGARVSVGVDDVEAIRAVAARDQAAAAISGLRVEHSGAFVVLVKKGEVAPQPAPFRFDLPIPGVVRLPAGGWTLEAEGPIERKPGPYGVRSPDQVEIESASLGSALVVRSRQPGDRIRPLGLGGQKKVQDVLVDRKVDRDARDLVPIVTDRLGRIVWVAGHVLGEDFRVTDRTNTVVILKLRRI